MCVRGVKTESQLHHLQSKLHSGTNKHLPSVSFSIGSTKNPRPPQLPATVKPPCSSLLHVNEQHPETSVVEPPSPPPLSGYPPRNKPPSSPPFLRSRCDYRRSTNKPRQQPLRLLLLPDKPRTLTSLSSPPCCFDETRRGTSVTSIHLRPFRLHAATTRTNLPFVIPLEPPSPSCSCWSMKTTTSTSSVFPMYLCMCCVYVSGYLRTCSCSSDEANQPADHPNSGHSTHTHANLPASFFRFCCSENPQPPPASVAHRSPSSPSDNPPPAAFWLLVEPADHRPPATTTENSPDETRTGYTYLLF